MLTGMADYMERLKRMSYLELMEERERLLGFLHRFEMNETAGDRNDPVRRGCPSPAVQYQVYFDYLSVLCGVMRERYKREYVFGRRTLKEDAEAEIVRSTAG